MTTQNLMGFKKVELSCGNYLVNRLTGQIVLEFDDLEAIIDYIHKTGRYPEGAITNEMEDTKIPCHQDVLDPCDGCDFTDRCPEFVHEESEVKE
jgi:hypothetical protein